MVIKYAFYLLVLILVLCGAYYTGYRVGSSDKQVEYVTKEVEVIKYVEKKKSDIYSRPNLDRQSLLKLMYNSKL